MYHHQQRQSVPLSIDTSFSQDWTSSSHSPFSSSPSTPQLYSQHPSPSPCHTADEEDAFVIPDFNIGSFTTNGQFDHYGNQQQQHQQPQSLDMSSAFLPAQFDVLSRASESSLSSPFGTQDQSKFQLACQDPTLSALMSSWQSTFT